MDANKTKDKLLRGESSKKRFTFYLTEETVKAFEEACKPLKPSPVIDELMRDFVKDIVKKKASKSTRKATRKKV